MPMLNIAQKAQPKITITQNHLSGEPCSMSPLINTSTIPDRVIVTEVQRALTAPTREPIVDGVTTIYGSGQAATVRLRDDHTVRVYHHNEPGDDIDSNNYIRHTV
jgi:hypothetical protein